jgi:hypothetical protein
MVKKYRKAPRAALAFLLVLLASACAYESVDFEFDVATAICECCRDCRKCDDYFTACMGSVGPDRPSYSDCAFDPQAARECVRAWKRRPCAPPCAEDEYLWEWDSIEECEAVFHSCED